MLATATTIGLGTWLIDKIKDKGFDALYSKLTSSDEINISFNKAVTQVSRNMHQRYPGVLAGRMEYFFKSDSVFKELIKLLFFNSTVNLDIVASSFDTQTLPPNFIFDFVSELKLEVMKDARLAKLMYDKELFVLVYGISNEIENIAMNSNLAVAEIKEIKEMLEQRIGEKFKFQEFLKLYAGNAVNNLSQVNFIGLGVGADISKKINRKKLDDIFVKPNFKLSENKFLKDKKYDEDDFFIDEDYKIKYNQLFNFGDRIIILGNPGSGKSVLIKSIICSILNSISEFDDEDLLKYLPFRIELRKYLAYKKQNRGNIVKYLNSLLEEEYGVNNMTELLLEDILNTKSSIFFFDGLDEIFKVEDKIDIKNDIEIFHNSFPSIKSITTSRIIGYEEAKLNEERFCELQINNFDDSQIQEYLTKWYEKEEEVAERRDLEVDGFLAKKHEIDFELVSNPLLLSLIVIIYRNTLALPESKLEIYQSCTKTLVEKWDASKADLEINLEPSIYKKRENILADLAYWQYQQLSGDEIDITFEKALNNVANSLEKLRISDESDSYTMAESFMAYAQKRSIYFDNNFTHKTFLEYYAAFWIYSNIEKKNKTIERNLIIAKYVENPFWHIVLELLLNMIDKNQADTEIMDELIYFQIQNDKKSLPFVLATIRSYKNVSFECLKYAIDEALYLLINCYDNNNFDTGESNHTKIFETVKSIYNDQEIKKIIISNLVSNEQKEEFVDLVYALYFEIALIDSSVDDESFNFALSDKNKFDEKLEEVPFFIISSCYNVCSKRNKLDYFNVATKFISRFGVQKFYDNIPFYFESNSYLPVIFFYFRTQILSENIKDISCNLKSLMKLGVELDGIINFFKTSDIFFNLETEQAFIEIFDNEEDESISMILCLLLFSSRISQIRLKEAIKERKKTIFLQKLLPLTREEKISEILAYHNYNS